jgi:hypothetical protein
MLGGSHHNAHLVEMPTNQGWSEPTATNAPVQDEAIQAVLGMN